MQNFVELLKDHALIRAAATSLTDITRAAQVDPQGAFLALRKLATLLDAHLRAEDEFLNRDRVAGRNEFKALAEQHGERFTDLCAEWGIYLKEWTEENIAADWNSFVWMTDWIVELLNEQVEAENAALYPAALRFGLIRLLPEKPRVASR